MDSAATLDAPRARKSHEGLPKFDLDDACCLKSDHSLVGHVSRTHYDIGDHEPLDTLIISYTSVPEVDIVTFLGTGTPPKGYAFVTFDEHSQGSALIHEDDLVLVDRTLSIGQAVKRHVDDTASGMVINTATSCSLEPIVWRSIELGTGECGPLEFTHRPTSDNNNSSADDMDVLGPPQLHDIPQSELTHYEHFVEGDHIIYRQKVGVIQTIDRDAIILLDNQRTVCPRAPDALELPVSYDPSDIVTFPNESSPIRTHTLTDGRTIRTADSESVYPGQFIITPPNNLSRADRSPTYGPASWPQGYVVATPPMDVHVDWLCPNVFAVEAPVPSASSETLRATTLNENIVKCDFGQLPSDNMSTKAVRADTWLRIGDRVRFRDPKAAAAKYPLYRHIPADQSFGHDLNILRVTSLRTIATVQWQDGSVTTEKATNLHMFPGADGEVWPGSIVVLKDKVETVRRPLRLGSAAISQLYVYAPPSRDIIRARQVGVVQTVNSRERIASVRWYKDPHVEMISRGNILSPGSYLGELGNTISEVSLYELNSYPALTRELDDLVILAPETVHQLSIEPSTTAVSPFTGPCDLSYLSPISFSQTSKYLESMKLAMIQSNWFKSTTKIDISPLPPWFRMHHNELTAGSSAEFIGKILSMDVNGVMTVRLVGADKCRDICVPFERVMLVIDDENLATALSTLELLDFTSLSSSSSEILSSPHSQTSGPSDRGHHARNALYDDLEDSDWMTDEDDLDHEDDDEALELDLVEDKPMSDSSDEEVSAPRVSEIAISEGTGPEQGNETLPFRDGVEDRQVSRPSILSHPPPSSPPAAFSVLETSPPSDHHFYSKHVSGATGPRMKRIRKEFEILQTSLPPGIFFRSWESRMDLARVLILGPQGTPYEYAPFVIDFHFSSNFPNQPPTAFFHSWTNGQGPVNPNLYEDGKICLSILGTWHTKNPEESWSPGRSTLLQILVSLMGLVLVKEPFYNEAGYEVFAVEGDRQVESTQYTEKAFLMTRRFIQHALEHPVAAFEDVILWHYLPARDNEDGGDRPQLLRRACEEALRMIEHHNHTSVGDTTETTEVASPFVSRLSLGAVVMLRKHITALEKLEMDMMASRP